MAYVVFWLDKARLFVVGGDGVDNLGPFLLRAIIRRVIFAAEYEPFLMKLHLRHRLYGSILSWLSRMVLTGSHVPRSHGVWRPLASRRTQGWRRLDYDLTALLVCCRFGLRPIRLLAEDWSELEPAGINAEM